jgi:hypothetical protein
MAESRRCSVYPVRHIPQLLKEYKRQVRRDGGKALDEGVDRTIADPLPVAVSGSVTKRG